MIDRKKKKPLWEVFSKLLKMVRQDHIEKGAIGGSHDIVHALFVAQYAGIIAESKKVGILAWVAGIIHNTDRLFSEEKVKEQLHYYLIHGTNFSKKEKKLIFEAVINHSKLNNPKDNSVTVTLKDADKLANIGPNIFIRSAQFYHNLLAFDPRYLEQVDPTSNIKNPKTVLRDIMFSLEWGGKDPNNKDWIRLPKAKKLSNPWFKQLRAFVEGFAKQLEEVNLLPYPFPQDFTGLNK